VSTPHTDRLRVSEIFYSIQGESTYAGWPCLFVRLTGCNLRCSWCDTSYAFDNGHWTDVPSVVETLRSMASCKLVEITGGEPLLQKPVLSLMQTLLDLGYTVLLETSGSVDIREVPVSVRRIVDIKAPGSGEADKNLWQLEALRPSDELKVVLADRADFDWAAEAVRSRSLLDRCPVHFSPVLGLLDPKLLCEWVLEADLAVRVNLQIQKFIWDPHTRGV